MCTSPTTSNLAVVILSYADYESLELTLAAHSKLFNDDGVKFYILQNGRGSYDCERTLRVALRYQELFPRKIKVVTDISPKVPYFAIKELLHKESFADVDFVIKLDDDVFPLTPNWIDKLCDSYVSAYKKYGESLAYVTSLVNNNPYGFKKVLEIMNLEDDYFNNIARDHFVGLSQNDPYSPYRVLPKEKIFTGGGGTIWRYAYIARWLHHKTTLNVDDYIEATKSQGLETLNSKERYSINCLLFKKTHWDNIRVDFKDTDDELLWQKYCIHNKKEIVADLSVPMVHLFFYTQREENKDLMRVIRDYFEQKWNLPFPISLNNDRILELENRLRFVEMKMSKKMYPASTIFRIESVKNYVKRKLHPDSFLYRFGAYLYHRFFV